MTFTRAIAVSAGHNVDEGTTNLEIESLDEAHRKIYDAGVVAAQSMLGLIQEDLVITITGWVGAAPNLSINIYKVPADPGPKDDRTLKQIYAEQEDSLPKAAGSTEGD